MSLINALPALDAGPQSSLLPAATDDAAGPCPPAADLTATTPPAASNSAPQLAVAFVVADHADRASLVDQVTTAIGAAVTVLDRRGTDVDVRLVLDGDAQVHITASDPARPETRPHDTTAVCLVVERPGRLDHQTLRALTGAVDRIGFTTTEMRLLRALMPLTTSSPRHLPPQCLHSVAPVLTVHHMTDFLVMVEAVRAMGVPAEAITVIDKGYPYRHTHRVDAHLRRAGITVFPWTATAQALADHTRRARALGRSGLLVDDGGYTLPVLLSDLPDLVGDYCGLVEQTMSGITRLQAFPELPVPVFSVAESRLKATIEPFGVADAAVRNLLTLIPDEKLEGQPALVIGFGRIGAQLAEILRDRRMRVAVYDQHIAQLVAAHERGFVTSRSLPQLLREHQPLLVFGSTGHTSLRGEHARALRRDCYLVSTTSRTREFALDELGDEARSVSAAGILGYRLHLPHGPVATVVGGGYPINFHHAESMPNKYADLILASLLVGAAALAKRDRSGLVSGHNLARTNTILESCGLLERYYARFGPPGR